MKPKPAGFPSWRKSLPSLSPVALLGHSTCVKLLFDSAGAYDRSLSCWPQAPKDTQVCPIDQLVLLCISTITRERLCDRLIFGMTDPVRGRGTGIGVSERRDKAMEETERGMSPLSGVNLIKLDEGCRIGDLVRTRSRPRRSSRLGERDLLRGIVGLPDTSVVEGMIVQKSQDSMIQV